MKWMPPAALRALFSGCPAVLTKLGDSAFRPDGAAAYDTVSLLGGVERPPPNPDPVPVPLKGATATVPIMEAARPHPSGGHLWCIDDSVIITCLKVIRADAVEVTDLDTAAVWRAFHDMGVRGAAAAAGAIAATYPKSKVRPASPLDSGGPSRDAVFERLANAAGLSIREADLMADRGTSECPLLRRVMGDVYGGRVVPVTAALIVVHFGKAPRPVALRAAWLLPPTRPILFATKKDTTGDAPIRVTPRLIHLPATSPIDPGCAPWSRPLEVPALAPLAMFAGWSQRTNNP